MSKICTHFDTYFDAWCGEIGALCFLLCRSSRGADDVAFQTFLRLGGAKDTQIGREDARMLLFSSAVRLCDDYYLKKLRLPPSRAALESQNPAFPVTDPLMRLLRLPFSRRAALALHHFGFSVQEIAQLLNRPQSRVQALLRDPGIEGWEDALDSMKMTGDEALVMNDRIYERFSIRSVGVENFIHDARNTFDRLVPFFALAVLALFALAVWYVKR